MNLGLVRDNFSFQAANTLSSLFDQPDFSDVTLVCEDQKQILAHKVILAYGSPFFKNIVSLNPHPRPLIYLKVKFSDLQEIVRFIYTGQCSVAQNELDGFLDIAKSLEIVGIFNDEGLKVGNISNAKTNYEEKATFISENGAVFEDRNEQTDVEGACDNDSNTGKKDSDNLYDIKGEPEENIEKAVCLFCNECNLRFPTNAQLKEHVNKDHLFCCDKIFPSMKSLNSHKWVHNTKSRIQDPDIQYPETDEQLTFFKTGRNSHAFDKNFFSFGYIFQQR